MPRFKSTCPDLEHRDKIIVISFLVVENNNIIYFVQYIILYTMSNTTGIGHIYFGNGEVRNRKYRLNHNTPLLYAVYVNACLYGLHIIITISAKITSNRISNFPNCRKF